jgi:hypothetical protein
MLYLRWRKALRDRPAGAGLKQAHAASARKTAVVNDALKRHGRTCHVGIRETNASEPLMTHRNALQMTSKPGAHHSPGISVAVTCLLATWCPVYRWRDSNPGSGPELGNSACDVKGKPYKWDPRRGKSTDAYAGGGSSRTSVEVPVMGMEQRG